MQTYEIKNTSGEVIFTASLPNKTLKSKLLKLAVEQAIKAGVSLKNAYLRYTDLSGADLSGADLSGAIFTGADLYGVNFTGAIFIGANLYGVNFTGADLRFADLSGAIFTDANLSDANLSAANLYGADFQHAILKDAILPDGVPYIPNLDKLIYEALQMQGNNLNMKIWHHPYCNTTHCRYGWAIHLAGKAGYALEAKFGPETAGALIYAKTYPELPIPAFTGDNEKVMADIKMRAGV